MELSFKTRQQIAGEYKITPKTLISGLEKQGILLPPCSLSLKLQKLIYDTLGYPPGINKSDYDNV
jgi:hypothetical protein